MPKEKKEKKSVRSSARCNQGPYGVKGGEKTERLSRFLNSARSQRRNAVVDPDLTFGASVGLPLGLNGLSFSDPQAQAQDVSDPEDDSAKSVKVQKNQTEQVKPTTDCPGHCADKLNMPIS